MNDLKSAKARVSHKYGKDVADKASDNFCLAHGGDAMAMAESGPLPGRIATVLEMVRPIQGASESTQPLRNTQAWWRAVEEVAKATIARSPSHSAAILRASTVLRSTFLNEIQAEFSRTCGGILDELGRAAGGPLGPLSEVVTASAVQPRLVEACWLNCTARTAADPATVASVAAAKQVVRIDVPRRLTRELTDTPGTCRATNFRSSASVTGQGVIVAVIDSEVSAQHPALVPRVVHKRNFTKEPWGYPDSHGTAVAGIIGANSNSVTGIAPDVTIWNYKVLATNELLNADDFGGSRAIQQALEDGAHIANCSWGAGPAGDGTSREAVACDTAWALGLTIVKSAGNRGPGAGTLTTPADAEGIIVAGGTDRRGLVLGDYSSRGPTADGRERPHVVAPGALPADGMTSCLTSGGFGDCGYGTSYAAPHVSGMLALLLDQNPNLDPNALRDALLLLTQLLPGVAGPNVQGRGRVVFP